MQSGGLCKSLSKVILDDSYSSDFLSEADETALYACRCTHGTSRPAAFPIIDVDVISIGALATSIMLRVNKIINSLLETRPWTTLRMADKSIQKYRRKRYKQKSTLSSYLSRSLLVGDISRRLRYRRWIRTTQMVLENESQVLAMLKEIRVAAMRSRQSLVEEKFKRAYDNLDELFDGLN